MVPYGIEPDKKPIGLIIGITLGVIAVLAGGILYFNYASHNVAKQQADAIRTQITQPVALAAQQAVKQDVTNTVIAVQTYLSTQGGSPINYAAIPTHASIPGESIVITPNGSGFIITGTHAASGFSYTYDSTTGSYR